MRRSVRSLGRTDSSAAGIETNMDPNEEHHRHLVLRHLLVHLLDTIRRQHEDEHPETWPWCSAPACVAARAVHQVSVGSM
ncbi:hypothetical protein [Actinokineospora sp. HUAS TT18]|uniref:hypothetical protein n=1 Tax=Actinokineospora sp. HUAS TT18 TaxID=3447451 RepID=UPI003F520D00